MEGYLRSFKSIFATPGWPVQMAIFVAMWLVPIVGPFVVSGWMMDRIARVAAGDTAVPPLAFGRHLKLGFAAFVGMFVWMFISTVTFGLGGLVMPAFMAEFAVNGNLGSFFAFKPVLGKLKQNVMPYLIAMLKVLSVGIPASLLMLAAEFGGLFPLARAAQSGGSLIMPAIIAVVCMLLFYLVSYFVSMAGGYFYGEYYRTASGGGTMAPAGGFAPAGFAPAGFPPPSSLTPLTVAAGVVGTDDDEFEMHPSLLPPVPAVPSNVVATFSEASASLSMTLPGQHVLYEAGVFRVPALGKEFTAANIAQMDGAGVLLWANPQLREAVLKMATGS